MTQQVLESEAESLILAILIPSSVRLQFCLCFFIHTGTEGSLICFFFYSLSDSIPSVNQPKMGRGGGGGGVGLGGFIERELITKTYVQSWDAAYLSKV